MSNTIREQIISSFMTRLASWTTAGGFHFSCGPNALRAVKEVEDLPACVLWPELETSEPGVYGQDNIDMTFRLEAFAEVEDDVNPSVFQERLLGDARKIMTDPSVTVTSLIDSIAYIEGGPADLIKSEDRNVGVSARFRVKYETLSGNPYSQ